jgi:cytochrome P450 family 9
LAACVQTHRICTQDFKIEPKNPHEKALLIEKGVDVVVPIRSLHYDPRYFSDPDRFDPERFSDENKGKIVPGELPTLRDWSKELHRYYWA